MQQGRKVDVIGIQMDLGASRRGVNMGRSAIRYSGLLEKMKGLGLSPRDCGDIIPRTQDLDRQRTRQEYVFEARGDLDALGLFWDQGGEVAGPHAP